MTTKTTMMKANTAMASPPPADDIRTIDLELSGLNTRSLDDGQMEISGYAVRFNQPSQPMPFIEYIDPDALDGVDLSDLLLVRSHDLDEILARADSKTLTTKIDSKGLFFTAQLPNTTLGRDTYADIQAGNIKGCSMGFKIGKDVWSTNSQGQNVHEIQQIASMTEISLTPIPAYVQTSVQVQRSLANFLKEGNQLNNQDPNKKQQQDVNTPADAKNAAPAPADNANTKPAPAPAAPNNGNQGNNAPKASGNANSGVDIQALAKAVANILEQDNGDDSDNDDNNDQTRDDDNDNDIPDERDDASQKKQPTGNSNEVVEPVPGTKSSPNAGNQTQSASQPTQTNPNKQNQTRSDKSKEGNVMRDLTHTKENAENNAFYNYLKTGNVTRDVTGGLGLSMGQVLIPKDILPAEHETHQFQRLGNLVRTISVKHTTGTLPVFDEETQALKLHTEFAGTTPANAPTIKQILWNLKTYTGEYVFSQDLISDSDYNWQSELQARLTTLRDNTDDQQITNQLVAGETAVKADDLLDQIVDILDRKLKPQDSQAASILLSQSAFAQLDEMKDKEGRPLVQPDVTTGTGKQIKGKTVVIVDDTLFPNAKAGDVNMIIAPMQKAVIKFQNNTITGQFQDTYDIWYKRLGIYMRCDYVQARPDLINWVSSTTGASSAASKITANTGSSSSK